MRSLTQGHSFWQKERKIKKVQNSHPCPGHWLMGQMLSCPWYSQVQGPFLASVWTSWQAQGPVPAGKYPARASFSKATLSKEHLLRQTRPQGDQVSRSQSFSYRHSHTGPTEAHTQGRGRGVALLHGKIKPFVREQGPSLGHANV